MSRYRLALVLMLIVAMLGGGLARPRAVGAAQACFQETGFCAQGRFLDYWQQHGGLARNGFPLSGERRELLEDGREYTVQYFERVRLELHPENAAPYDVLLGQFGRRALTDAIERAETGGFLGGTSPVAASPGQAYFPETGHNLGGRFLAYWQANGGLAQFGFPLTEEGQERLGPPTAAEPVATFLTVQYFERARLEYHPENTGTSYEVLLGQFGRAILADNQYLSGDFGRLYLTTPAVQRALGEPTGPVRRVSGATQEFERGQMIWQGDERRIYVLCGDAQAGQLFPDSQSGTPYYLDTWAEGQEPGGGPGPQQGLYQPQRGFGKVWREHPAIRQCLGYARRPDEAGYTLQIQPFGLDLLLSVPGAVYALDIRSIDGKPAGDYARYPLPTP